MPVDTLLFQAFEESREEREAVVNEFYRSDIGDGMAEMTHQQTMHWMPRLRSGQRICKQRLERSAAEAGAASCTA